MNTTRSSGSAFQTSYDRIRAWRRILNLNDPVAQLAPIMEEVKELDEAVIANNAALLKDAIGDVAVTAIVMFDAVYPSERIEFGTMPKYATLVIAMGTVAEGVRKPKKRDQIRDGCRGILAHAMAAARKYNLNFETECLEPVCTILESRLKEGYGSSVGTAIKKGDI